MMIKSIRALRGPNMWARCTALELAVELDAQDVDTAAVTRLLRGLGTAGLPKDAGPEPRPSTNSLESCPHTASDDCTRPSSPQISRIAQGQGAFVGQDLTLSACDITASPEVTLAHALAHLALELQQRAGCPVRFARSRPTQDQRSFTVVVEYRDEKVGRKAVDCALRILTTTTAGCTTVGNTTVGNTTVGNTTAGSSIEAEIEDAVREVREIDEDVRLGPSTGSIVRAAERRGIPCERLNEGSLVRLGWGTRQRRILAAETDKTSAIAESIAQDKELTKTLLRGSGVPVPEGREVASPEEAWSAALEIGVPVVVKPKDGNQGRGVTVNLTTQDQVEAAFAAAKRESSHVIVERCASGSDFRILVIGGRVVAAARREPPQVLGDGVHSIAELVEAVNRDPRRSDGHATSLTKIRLDEIGLAVLTSQGRSSSDIPGQGETIVLRRNANLSTGGSAIDVTDDVHPDVAERAVDAARAVGLDIAGVDVVCRDITRPLEAQGGVIVEVNAAPGLRMHLDPSHGSPRPVGEAIISMMFGSNDDGRIPVVAVTGTNGKTTTARLVAHILRATGKRVGMTSTDGIYIDDRRIDRGDCSGPKSARAVLANPSVEAAVLETARGGILREGLGFDFCDVAIVTNIGAGDHLGMAGIDRPEQLARVKRTVVESVHPRGAAVLNADDPLVLKMAGASAGHAIYFSRKPDSASRRALLQSGAPVVFVEDGQIVAAIARGRTRVVALAQVPITRRGTIPFQVENVLAAVAACWALNIEWSVVEEGLSTFAGGVEQTPGRFNVLHWNGATIIADYGHNADALRALIEALPSFPHRRRLAVFSCAGDRRDEDMIEQGELLGNHFDDLILLEDQCQRGRPEGAIIGLMRQGIARARRVRSVLDLRGEMTAIETALRQIGPGDLALVQVDQIDAALAFISEIVERSGVLAPQFRQPASSAGAIPRPRFPRLSLGRTAVRRRA